MRRRVRTDLVKNVALFVDEMKITRERGNSSIRYWCCLTTRRTSDEVSSGIFIDKRLDTLSTEGVTTKQHTRITIRLTTF